MSTNGWIGVDLDGTLAMYDGWRGQEHIGEPVPAMLERVKRWLDEGKEVRIFTARLATSDDVEFHAVREAIFSWCDRHLGTILPVTNVKDFGMVELWDDRAITVEANTGRVIKHPKGEPTP